MSPDNSSNHENMNVIVMSEAGKPIFSRFGSEAEVARICGLIQALRTSVNSKNTFQLGEIQSLTAGSCSIAFMTVQSVSLVAISTAGPGEQQDFIQAYLRLQLEYVYAQLISSFTSQVQTAFDRNPSLDLQSQMTSCAPLMRAILEDSSSRNPGPFLIGGVQVLYPLSSATRHRVSKILQSLYSSTPNTAFAVVLAGDQLLSLVQPSYRNHQIRASDLHLLMTVAIQQPDLYQAINPPELWIPVCLPRLNSSGYFYAYISCLHAPTKLTLILISPMGSTDQFQQFRSTSIRIREEMGIPLVDGSIITIDGSIPGKSVGETRSNSDLEWSREEAPETEDHDSNSDDDYVQISADGESMTMTPIKANFQAKSLLSEIHSLESRQSDMLSEILDSVFADELHINHFVFRVDVPVKNCSKQHIKQAHGNLTQCIIYPPTHDTSLNSDEKLPAQLWSSYQTLGIRLRLGSATIESTMDAFDMILQDKQEENEINQDYNDFPGIGQYCPVMSLLESPPNLHGITFIREGQEVFLAMNGAGFEL